MAERLAAAGALVAVNYAGNHTAAADTVRMGSKGIDILVDNIGGGDYATILDSNEAPYDQTCGNNVRVINISSAGSRLTDPGIIIYSMAKAPVEAFTRVLAQDMGHRGITVNAWRSPYPLPAVTV